MIYVYDKELTPIGLFEEFESFQFTQKYQDAGDFTIKSLVTDKTVELLQLQHFIVYKDFCGIIETVLISTDTDGTQTIEASGRDLLGLLSYRAIISAYEQIDVNCKTLINKIITENVTVSGNRNIPYLTLGTLVTTTGKTYTYNDVGANVLDIVKKIAETADIGIRVKHDVVNKTFEFETYTPTASDVVVGRKFDNVLTQDYTVSTVNGFSYCRAFGTLAGTSTRKNQIVGDDTAGLDRREKVVKWSNGRITDSTKLEKQLLQVAKDNIDSIVRCLDIDVYNVSLNVGDTVRVIDAQWNIDVTTPCTEKQISIQDGEITTTYILGNDIKLKETA